MMAPRLLLALALVSALPADAIRVTPLVRDGDVFVSFTAPGAVTAELREAIRSGMVITFTYDVTLRQGTFLWFTRTVGEAEIAAGVRFDNLTRTYHVTRMVDGRVIWSESSASEDQVRAWLTEFDRLKLFAGAALQPNAEYAVDIRARISPRRAFMLWPFGRHDATGSAPFTYIR